jgi:GNAT superfamily N-acetyltransferase
MSTVVVDIRPITEPDIVLLEKYFQKGGIAKHAERFLRQQKGAAVYLIAWYQGQPVGHALLKWGGSQDEPVAKQLRVACSDIEDLFVLAERRSQGIGRQLLYFAERLAWEQGYTYIGLSVGAKPDEPARRLYERLGYQDAHFGEYTERGEYLDPQGRHHIWEEVCLYLIKDLQAKDIQQQDSLSEKSLHLANFDPPGTNGGDENVTNPRATQP